MNCSMQKREKLKKKERTEEKKTLHTPRVIEKSASVFCLIYKCHTYAMKIKQNEQYRRFFPLSFLFSLNRKQMLHECGYIFY